jgi:hypothetical protein
MEKNLLTPKNVSKLKKCPNFGALRYRTASSLVELKNTTEKCTVPFIKPPSLKKKCTLPSNMTEKIVANKEKRYNTVSNRIHSQCCGSQIRIRNTALSHAVPIRSVPYCSSSIYLFIILIREPGV